MRTSLKELLDKLGVGYILAAYDSCPWSAYDDEKGVSCNAEVRMDANNEELEAELLMMRDDPQGDEKPVEQIYFLRAEPASAGQWDVKKVMIKGEVSDGQTYGYEEKSVDFFNACVQELQKDLIPDIDELLAKHMKSNERFGKKGGSGGNKSPKIKPAQVMNVKQGM
jgi:hypothetical protein